MHLWIISQHAKQVRNNKNKLKHGELKMKNHVLILALTFASAASAFANCEISNELDRDAWDSTVWSVGACLNKGFECEGQLARDKSVVTVRGIDDGVGTASFTLIRAQDGTQNLIGYSQNLNEVFLNAKGLPANAEMTTILSAIYGSSANLPWGCQWQ